MFYFDLLACLLSLSMGMMMLSELLDIKVSALADALKSVLGVAPIVNNLFPASIVWFGLVLSGVYLLCVRPVSLAGSSKVLCGRCGR
jgi:hypothetical protein